MRCDEGKTRYESQEEAEDLIHAINGKRAKKGRDPLPLRVYRCPFCDTWHLTSAPKRDRYAWAMSGGGQNPELYDRLVRRRIETPLFDYLVKEHGLRGKAFR